MNKKTLFRYENFLITIMFLTYGLVWMDRYSIIYLFPFIERKMNLTNTDLGLAMSVLAITWGLSSVIFSYLSDKFGSKKLFLILSIELFSLSTFLSGVVTTFGMLLILRGIMGMAEGPAIPLIQSTVMAESSTKRRGFNLGFVLSGSALLGNGLTPIMATSIASHFDWRFAFYSLAIPGFVIAFILMKYLKEPKTHSSDEKPYKPTLTDYKNLFKNKNINLSIITAILYMAFLFSFTTFLPLFLINVGEYTETQAGTLVSIFGVVVFAWNIVVAIISDKIGRKSTTLIFSFISCLIPVAVITFYTNYLLLMFLLALLAAGLGYQTLIMFVIPGESVPKAIMASTTALIILIGETIGGSIGPYISGVLSDKFSLFAPLWFSLAVSFLLFLVSFGFKETAPSKVEATLIQQPAK